MASRPARRVPPDTRGGFLAFLASSRNRKLPRIQRNSRKSSSAAYIAPLEDSISNRGSFLAPQGVGNRQSKARIRLGHDCTPTSVRWLGGKLTKPARGRKLELVA